MPRAPLSLLLQKLALLPYQSCCDELHMLFPLRSFELSAGTPSLPKAPCCDATHRCNAGGK